MTDGVRLLLIEDSENDAMTIALALRGGDRSVEYERVENAVSLHAALDKGPWDLIIADWSIPTLSAVAALEIAKERGLDVPFIIVSGTLGEETAVEAMRAGAHDFVDKGNLARLNLAVDRELHAKRGRDAHRQNRETARVQDAAVRASIESRQSPSVAQQLRRTFAMIGGLVGAAFVATALSFSVSSVWLIPAFDECRDVSEAAGNLNLAMLDQETALRGFLLTRDATFLRPYHRGELAAARADEKLDAHAISVPVFAMGLAREREAADRWHEMWAKPVAEMPTDGTAPLERDEDTLFEAYRAAHTAFAASIAERTELLARRSRDSFTVKVGLELLLFVSLLILAWRQHRALRDAIVAPVAALLQDIDRVREGELNTTIRQAGPSELRQLAVGLNDMVRVLAASRESAASRDQALRDHSVRLRQILHASREFSESLNLGYVVRSVSSSTMALGGYDEAVVWLLEDDQKGLRDAGLFESGSMLAQSRDDTLAWRAAKSGRLTFEGLDGRVQFGDGGSGRVRARAIPLIVRARVVGALEARHAEARAANDEAVEVLEMLASHAATAVESARLNEIAEERSQMDPLTRLHNRRRLEEDLDAECKRCTRYGRPLAFVMLDVDNFKLVNDTHGHPQADVALQEVAEVIGGTVRTTDSAYRYGGEEFCILLRETGAESAMHFAERLRQRIELRFATGTTPGITASFGVAEISADAQTPRALIEAADAAMYESKRGGRNRVVLSTPPPGTTLGSLVPPALTESLAPASSCTLPTTRNVFAGPEAQSASRRRS